MHSWFNFGSIEVQKGVQMMYKGKNYYTLNVASNGVYYYYAYDTDGRRYKRSTGMVSKRLALEEIQRRIELGTLISRDGEQDPSMYITFSEYAEPFWIWDTCPIIQDKLARGGHYSEDLCASNRKSMEKHILPYFGDMKLGKITRKDIDQWILNLPKEHNISSSTANKMLAILKQMLRMAVYKGDLKESPADGVRPLVEKENRRGAFTADEVEKLFGLKWTTDDAYIASFLAAFTGMRLGEIRALRPSRIHKEYILVDSSWSDASGLKSTKSGKARVVPITLRIYNMLTGLMEGREDEELIFSKLGRTPYEDRHFSLPLKDAMTRAGIDFISRNLSFHSFRHFFNTQIIAAGVSGEIARNVVGHESEDMTDHYLHLGSKELDSVRRVQLDLTRDIRRDRV